MNTGQNFMMMRYADVLLSMPKQSLPAIPPHSDGEALAAFNRVRTRAGLSAKTTINIDDILHERRYEFAFEGDYWYDVQRQGYAKAKAIIEAQDRGQVVHLSCNLHGELHVSAHPCQRNPAGSQTG
jgi:hypothetical protein